MTKKIFIKLVLFAVFAVLLIAYLNCVFTFPRNQSSDMARERFNSFYSLPDNTVDGIIIGTSGVDRYWIPPLAWKEDGVAVYGLTSGNQPIPFIKYIMQEALKSQNVKVFMIDLRGVLKDPDTIDDTDIRRVTDNMRFSSVRINATKDILSFVDGEESTVDSDDMSYYFKIAKYHSGWRELEMEDFTNLFPDSDYMGYFAYNTNAFKSRPIEKTEKITQECGPLDPRNEKALRALVHYCSTINTEVVFISSPQFVNEEEQKLLNSAFEIVEKEGYETINFNTEEMYNELGWDFEMDMYNSGHANFYGAEKFTRWVSEFLQDEYGIKNNRNSQNESDYVQWDRSYEKLMKRLKEFDEKHYEQIYIGK